MIVMGIEDHKVKKEVSIVEVVERGEDGGRVVSEGEDMVSGDMMGGVEGEIWGQKNVMYVPWTGVRHLDRRTENK